MRRRTQGLNILNPVSLLMLLLLFIGAATGLWSGRQLRALDTRQNMTLYQEALLSYANRLIGSVGDTLEQASQSPYPVCSADDLAYLRTLLFSAFQIKDIGRLVEGRLYCSTLLPDMGAPAMLTTPDVTLPNGIQIFGDRPLLTPGSHGPVLNKGNSNTVLSPVAFELMHRPGYSFTVFMSDPGRNSFARLYEYPVGAHLSPPVGGQTEEFDRQGDELSVHVCPPGGLVCVAVKTVIDQTGPAARLRSVLSVVLGMLAAGGLGLGWMIYRDRDRSLMSLLSKALTAKKLNVVYQPIVDIFNENLAGWEALIRWEIAKGDFVSPDVFITGAEKSGLIRKVTLYMIDTVIAEMGDLLRSKPALRININISSRDLDDVEFVDRMETRLADASIDPRQIGLELTERTPVDFAKASTAIHRLRQKGHRIYIDDFGTGYSSLAYLEELEVDAIKIDKAFTRTVGVERETVSIVPQIMAMARQHSLGVVVEGVETEAQAAYFRNGDIPVQAQGWYFGKPVSADAARRLAVTYEEEREKNLCDEPLTEETETRTPGL